MSERLVHARKTDEALKAIETAENAIHLALKAAKPDEAVLLRLELDQMADLRERAVACYSERWHGI